MSDPGLVFDDVRRLRSSRSVTHGPSPSALADALPNRRFWFNEGGRTIEFRFGTAVVVGEVVGATRGPAFAHKGDDELRRVDFDYPSAAERAVDVRVRIAELSGGPPVVPSGGSGLGPSLNRAEISRLSQVAPICPDEPAP